MHDHDNIIINFHCVENTSVCCLQLPIECSLIIWSNTMFVLVEIMSGHNFISGIKIC